MAWHTPGYFAHSLLELKLRKGAQVKVLREDLSIQTGKCGHVLMIWIISQVLDTGGDTLPSHIPLGEMPKLRTHFFTIKEQQMPYIFLRQYEG